MVTKRDIISRTVCWVWMFKKLIFRLWTQAPFTGTGRPNITAAFLGFQPWAGGTSWTILLHALGPVAHSAPVYSLLANSFTFWELAMPHHTRYTVCGTLHYGLLYFECKMSLTGSCVWPVTLYLVAWGGLWELQVSSAGQRPTSSPSL